MPGLTRPPRAFLFFFIRPSPTSSSRPRSTRSRRPSCSTSAGDDRRSREKQPANLEPVKLKDAPIKDGEEPTNRRQALTVEYGSGRSETVTNSAGVSMTHDMSLFDCPWSGALHSYLNLMRRLRVDGGLCLPYQEIPFPFSVGIAPVANGQPFPNLVTPSPNWDPDFAVCRVSASDIGSGFPRRTCPPCSYPGDAATHGGPTGIAENYTRAAAGNPGWVNLDGSVQITPNDAFNTPICKTYVSDCLARTRRRRRARILMVRRRP